MECGDVAQASIRGRFCPRCEAVAHQQYQWKPDLGPTRHRRRCWDCGWDSGWVPYDEWIVLRGGVGPLVDASPWATLASS